MSSLYSLHDEKLFFNLILERFGVKANKVLDIGCGCGFFTDLLSKFGLWTIGTDFDIERIKVAHSRYKSNFLISDSRRPPFSDNTFDLILSRGLSTFYTVDIYNSSNQRDVLFNLLKNDGVLIFVTASNLSGKRTTIQNHQLDDVGSFFKLSNTKVWTYFFFGKNLLFRILGNFTFNPIFSKLSSLMTKITKRSGYIVCIVRVQK